MVFILFVHDMWSSGGSQYPQDLGFLFLIVMMVSVRALHHAALLSFVLFVNLLVFDLVATLLRCTTYVRNFEILASKSLYVVIFSAISASSAVKAFWFWLRLRRAVNSTVK